MTREPKYPVLTVMKAIEIINCLSKNTSGRGVSLSELTRTLGLNKSTIHRILDTLQFYDYIEQDEHSNRYRLGWEIYKIGQVVPAQNQLYNIAPNLLIELNKKTQENVDLGILKHHETVILSQIEDNYNGSHVSINPGKYESIYATSLGKMLISEMDAEEIRELLDNMDPLPTFTAHTISSINELLHEVKIARQRGYAVDAEEYCDGLYCIAMPVRDYTGTIVAAVSVNMPTARFTEEKKQLVLDSLAETTGKMSELLGYRA